MKLSNFLIPCRLTCEHNTHSNCVDSKLLGVNGKERENGGKSRKEEEEVGLDGDQRGVDFEHHLDRMRLLAVSVAKCHVHRTTDMLLVVRVMFPVIISPCFYVSCFHIPHLQMEMLTPTKNLLCIILLQV